MVKNSTKANSLRVIQGGKAELVKSAKTLTHKDIHEFLATFAEAILVNQERVNKLPHKQFHPFYDDGMWQRNREDHVCALTDLSITVEDMPKRLLKKLTEFAVSYRPEAVRRSLLDIISDLATHVSSPELYETSSLFFNELIKDVRRRGPSISRKGDPMEMMLKWFDYNDPIAIAKDPECEYVDLLASHIEQESDKTRRALTARSRSAFIDMRDTIKMTTWRAS